MGKHLSIFWKGKRGKWERAKPQQNSGFFSPKKTFHNITFPNLGNPLSRFWKAKMVSKNQPFLMQTSDAPVPQQLSQPTKVQDGEICH